MSEFSDLRSQKLEPDIGHEAAIRQAPIAPVLVDGKGLRWQEGYRFRRGELKGRTTIIGNPADFNQKKVWTIQVRDQREYPIFLLRAHLYLTLQGIPYSLRHKTASKLIGASIDILPAVNDGDSRLTSEPAYVNTHKPAALYQAFEPTLARSLIERLEIHPAGLSVLAMVVAWSLFLSEVWPSGPVRIIAGKRVR